MGWPWRIFFVDFRRKNVYFSFTSNENGHFSLEKRLPPKTGCWFSSGKRHIPKQNHGNRQGFWRKITTTTVNPGNRRRFCVRIQISSFFFFHFSIFFISSFFYLLIYFILNFLPFSFIFFHFLSFSFIFYHFLLFSIIFFHFLSFFIFYHFRSFSFFFFVFVGCSKSDFFLGLNFVTISLDNSYVKNQFLGPSREVVVTPLGLLFLCSSFFFGIFFFFHFFWRKSFFFSFFLYFFQIIFFAGVSIRVSLFPP